VEEVLVAERDLPYEVPELRYVEVDPRQLGRLRSNLNNWWGDQIPIALCVRCERRYTEDPNKDAWGVPMHEDPEDDLEVVCKYCLSKGVADALEQDILALLEEKIGLTEENKKTLQALMGIIENPDRVMMVARVHDRVDELERRLEDRTEGVRDAVESKLENANTRLFISSLITNAALFLSGILFGIVVALLLGG
jgi:DNA-directed RNA polymerase subunit RPC12/RpoP